MTYVRSLTWGFGYRVRGIPESPPSKRNVPRLPLDHIQVPRGPRVEGSGTGDTLEVPGT